MKCFAVSIDITTWFSFVPFYVVTYVDWLMDVDSVLHTWNTSHLIWVHIVFMHWMWLNHSSSKIFPSLFMKDISFKFLSCILFFFFNFILFLRLYITVLVLPNIKVNPPQVYMCSPSWNLLPPPSPFHPSGSSHKRPIFKNWFRNLGKYPIVKWGWVVTFRD